MTAHRARITGRSKADVAFDKKLEALLVRPIVPAMSCRPSWQQPRLLREPLDIEAVERLFSQYGAYLELVDYGVDMTPREAKDTVAQMGDLLSS